MNEPSEFEPLKFYCIWTANIVLCCNWMSTVSQCPMFCSASYPQHQFTVYLLSTLYFRLPAPHSLLQPSQVLHSQQYPPFLMCTCVSHYWTLWQPTSPHRCLITHFKEPLDQQLLPCMAAQLGKAGHCLPYFTYYAHILL